MLLSVTLFAQVPTNGFYFQSIDTSTNYPAVWSSWGNMLQPTNPPSVVGTNYSWTYFSYRTGYTTGDAPNIEAYKLNQSMTNAENAVMNMATAFTNVVMLDLAATNGTEIMLVDRVTGVPEFLSISNGLLLVHPLR